MAQEKSEECDCCGKTYSASRAVRESWGVFCSKRCRNREREILFGGEEGNGDW